MGVFTFKWGHAAEEVYVTGTFDNWSKSEKLHKVGSGFEKEVTLPATTERIFYKFVVDGNWITDHTAPQAQDHEGNVNNVLHPEDIKHTHATSAHMAGVTPGSTSAALAASAPVEKREQSGLPGTFPETPAADFDKQFSIDPLPATQGALNPIQLEPGRKIPDTFKQSSVNDHVTLDQASYEQSDRLPGVTDIGTLPPVTRNMIPESSLPIAGYSAGILNSAHPQSSTAGLAAKVPFEEPAVPAIVKQSQEKAGFNAEASGIASEVHDKAKLEDELLSKVPEAPSTAEGTAGKGTEKAESDKTLTETVTGTLAGLGTAALGAAFAAKNAVIGGATTVTNQASAAATIASSHATTAATIATDHATTAATIATNQATAAAVYLPEGVKSALSASAQQAIADRTKETTIETVSPQVPVEVKESIAEAGVAPEAASNTLAVEEKRRVEAELLREVKPANPVDVSSSTHAPVTPAKDTFAPATPAKNNSVDFTSNTPASINTPTTISTPAKIDTPTSISTPVKNDMPASITTPASSSQPITESAPGTPDSKAAKKKNRLSQMFGKFKTKVSHKD